MVALAYRLQRAVEVDGIFGERVRGCQIGSAAEPGIHPLAALVRDLEVAHVEMDGRDHGAARVRNDAHAGDEESLCLDPRSLGTDALGESRLQHTLNGRS